MFKTIAGVAAATTCCLFNPAGIQEAKAGTWSYDGHILGYHVSSIYDSGSYGGVDVINVYGPAGLERITVRCSPFDWESYGANTATFSAAIAKSWCF